MRVAAIAGVEDVQLRRGVGGCESSHLRSRSLLHLYQVTERGTQREKEGEVYVNNSADFTTHTNTHTYRVNAGANA